MFVLIRVFWRTEMARIMEISRLRPFKKALLHCYISCYIVLFVVMQSHSCCTSEKVFYLVFDMDFFLGIEFWVNYISLSILRCGASVLWLTLFHMPNLLSFPFFVLLCLFFLLVTFLWLIVLNNELSCTFE